jgi:hypothetical protein
MWDHAAPIMFVRIQVYSAAFYGAVHGYTPFRIALDGVSRYDIHGIVMAGNNNDGCFLFYGDDCIDLMFREGTQRVRGYALELD